MPRRVSTVRHWLLHVLEHTHIRAPSARSRARVCLLYTSVYSREDYARRLMQQPASFYYGVLWNKLYRREIIAQNQLGFAPDVHSVSYTHLDVYKRQLS